MLIEPSLSLRAERSNHQTDENNNQGHKYYPRRSSRIPRPVNARRYSTSAPLHQDDMTETLSRQLRGYGTVNARDSVQHHATESPADNGAAIVMQNTET